MLVISELNWPRKKQSPRLNVVKLRARRNPTATYGRREAAKLVVILADSFEWMQFFKLNLRRTNATTNSVRERFECEHTKPRTGGSNFLLCPIRRLTLQSRKILSLLSQRILLPLDS